VTIRGKPSRAEALSSPQHTMRFRAWRWPGTLIEVAATGATRILSGLKMSDLKKKLKVGVIAGLCGVGLCALGRKLRLTSRVAEFAHSVEAVPFPGTRLYSFLASRQLRPLYAVIAEEIMAAGHFDRILDLGTGPGYLPIELALRDPAASVSGIDESPDMIRIASADARASRVTESVEFATGDPTNLPFPGRYFDLVVGVNVLHHWQQPLAVFEEVFHILTPGGQFWIYDYRRDVPQDVWESLQKHMPFYLRLALLFGPITSSKVAYSETDLLKMAEQTHFENPELLSPTLPLFGEPMQVFNLLKLHKPSHNTD